MRYEKPEVLSSVPAKFAIAMSSDKRFPGAQDINPDLGDSATSPAYEADE